MPRASPSRTPSAAAPSTYVALLRGINLAGKNKLAMADLAAIFAAAGCGDVRTYIQSGNVVFSATAGCAKCVPEAVPLLIAGRFGLRVPVVVRTAAEFRKVTQSNPFLKAGADPDALHVVFLADAPEKRLGAALDPQRSPGDSFQLRGREIYVQLPSGFGRSKLTNAYFDSTLQTISTARNWRTVLKLAEMAMIGSPP